MKRYRRHRNRSRGSRREVIIVFVCLVVFVFVLGTAYSAFSTDLSLNASGEVIDRSRIIQSWTSTSNEDFHTDYYRENIVNITFLDSRSVPSNAVESWDVSADGDGGVMAYVVTNEEDSTKYDLYIGAKNGVIANEDSSYLFYNMTGTEEINFNDNFDTSDATKMTFMFGGSNSLTTLDLSDFSTANVVNMFGMFSTWNVNLEEFGTTLLTNIIFGDDFVTINVTSMGDMFSGFGGTSLDLSGFDTTSVRNMYHMFTKCENLAELNLCSFDTSNVTDMIGMFRGTTNLTAIYVGNNWTTDNADTTELFYESNISSVTTGQC